MSQISPSHALLLLLRKYQSSESASTLAESIIGAEETKGEDEPVEGRDSEKYKIISQMLFSGRTPENFVQFDAFLAEAERDFGHTVNRTPEFIHNDPIRRYFETHVAHEFLKRQLTEFPLSFLQGLEQLFKRYFAEVLNHPELQECIGILNGGKAKDSHGINFEFANVIQALQDLTHPYADFTDEERKQLLSITKFTYLLNRITYTLDAGSSGLPLNLYETGFYNPNARGRIQKENQGSTLSHTYGLLKNIHPLPSSDITFRDTPVTEKPADKVRPGFKKAWPDKVFKTLTDPFSTSISGVMLTVIRALSPFLETLPEDVKKRLPAYLTLSASSLLFDMGGHSYNEFMHPLKLPKIQRTYSRKGIDLNSFNYADLLLQNGGLNKGVLKDCLEYADTLEKRKPILARLGEKQEKEKRVDQCIKNLSNIQFNLSGFLATYSGAGIDSSDWLHRHGKTGAERAAALAEFTSTLDLKSLFHKKLEEYSGNITEAYERTLQVLNQPVIERLNAREGGLRNHSLKTYLLTYLQWENDTKQTGDLNRQIIRPISILNPKEIEEKLTNYIHAHQKKSDRKQSISKVASVFSPYLDSATTRSAPTSSSTPDNTPGATS